MIKHYTNRRIVYLYFIISHRATPLYKAEGTAWSSGGTQIGKHWYGQRMAVFASHA